MNDVGRETFAYDIYLSGSGSREKKRLNNGSSDRLEKENPALFAYLYVSALVIPSDDGNRVSKPYEFI